MGRDMEAHGPDTILYYARAGNVEGVMAMVKSDPAQVSESNIQMSGGKEKRRKGPEKRVVGMDILREESGVNGSRHLGVMAHEEARRM